jgi:hypothetical protein
LFSATGAFAFYRLKTNRGCYRFKDWYFIYREARQICHVHVTVRKVRDQAQGLVDAFGKLDSRLLQSARIDRSYATKQKWVGNRASRSKDF